MSEDLKKLASDLLVLTELGKRVKAADLALRARYAELADEGDRTGWKLAGGPVGFVAVAAGAVRPKVTDEKALLRWVQKRRPTEVVTAPSIRPAYLSTLLAAAKEAGEAVDPSTGEAVPGISVEVGDPTVRVTPNPVASDLIEQEWRSGRLAVVPASVLPQIEGGAGDAE